MILIALLSVFIIAAAAYAGRMSPTWWPWVVARRGWISLEMFIATVAVALGFLIGQIFPYRPDFKDAAAWVQAVGSIAAIGIVVWIDQASERRRRSERAEQKADQIWTLMTVYASSLNVMDHAIALVEADTNTTMEPSALEVFADRLRQFGIADLPAGEAQFTLAPVSGTLGLFIENMRVWNSPFAIAKSLSGSMRFHRSNLVDALIRVSRHHLVVRGIPLTRAGVCRIFTEYGLQWPDADHPLFDFRLNGLS